MGSYSMEIIRIIITSTVAVITLFIITKILGDKQISQLSLFDYIIGISIGSIAADLSIELENPEHCITALIVFGFWAFAVTISTSKSRKLRKLLTGRSLIIMDNGVIYKENLKKARKDLSDFLTFCRTSGYFDLSQIQTAIFEFNGKMSFLPVEANRPATPQDLGVSPEQQYIITNVIMDGQICYDNLRISGKNEIWLNKEMHSKGYSSASEILLGTVDSNNKATFYPLKTDIDNSDRFE